MGKKSKNKAKARPVGGGKPPRCNKCASFVRTNGQTCPGCIRIFCHRCSDYFKCCPSVDCPSPTMRCPDCLGGATVEKMMKRGDIPNDTLPPDGMISKNATSVSRIIPSGGSVSFGMSPLFIIFSTVAPPKQSGQRIVGEGQSTDGQHLK
eukprot:CAMPEP_0178663628 /NCGR_PEP_ID=MMETSP0698-20121128/28934_1 /TAXON_ID=265572 /ORGANISM="Extubocellulus spinifer, Strain CCMP396" /LENGTH=149 /DNA_ID=CAMNT_0020306713 /DNA_START=45 /DNA_END=494 /DNA_ORIENTATION=+